MKSQRFLRNGFFKMIVRSFFLKSQKSIEVFYGIVAAKCTRCGANIEVDSTQEAGICSHCGTAFITEKAINNYNTYNSYNTTVNNTTNISGNSVVNVYSDEINKFYVIEGTTLTKYNGKIMEFKVPGSVTRVASRIFDEYWTPSSIFIPKSVITIDPYAFSLTGILKSITFEEDSNLRTIEEYAFHDIVVDCVILPESLNYIGGFAFSGVKSAFIPKSVQTIEKNAFYRADAVFTDGSEIPSGWSLELSGITITEVIKDGIGKVCNGFVYAETLKGPVIYDFVGKQFTAIPSQIDGKTVYSVFPAVKNKIPPSKATEYVFSKSQTQVKPYWCDYYPHVNKIIFEEPSKISQIGKRAFSRCFALKTIRLPRSVERIENEAFLGSGLKKIYLRGDIKYIGKHAFAETSYTTASVRRIIIEEGTTIESCDYDAFINKDAYSIYEKKQGKANKEIAEISAIARGSNDVGVNSVSFAGVYMFVPKGFDTSSIPKVYIRFLVYKNQKHLDKLLSLSDEELYKKSLKGCYIATAVYGSYDCPQVWVLRRYRDSVLSGSIFGRLFIKLYYRVSPKVVKIFGKSVWFNRFWKNALDKKVERLKNEGFEDKPYID